MGMPSMPELLIILTIIVLLFGAKKIPDLAKGIGSGIKNFKKAMKDDEDGEAITNSDQAKINANQTTSTQNRASTTTTQNQQQPQQNTQSQNQA